MHQPRVTVNKNIPLGPYICTSYIEYPAHNRPIVARLDRRICEVRSQSFANVVLKMLTYSDIHSGVYIYCECCLTVGG